MGRRLRSRITRLFLPGLFLRLGGGRPGHEAIFGGGVVRREVRSSRGAGAGVLGGWDWVLGAWNGSLGGGIRICVLGSLGGLGGRGAVRMAAQLPQKLDSSGWNGVQDLGEGGGLLENKSGHARGMEPRRVIGLFGRMARKPMELAKAMERLALHRQPLLRASNSGIGGVLRQPRGRPLALPNRAPALERREGGRVCHGGVSPRVTCVQRNRIRTPFHKNSPRDSPSTFHSRHPTPVPTRQQLCSTRTGGKRPTLPRKLSNHPPVRPTPRASNPTP